MKWSQRVVLGAWVVSGLVGCGDGSVDETFEGTLESGDEVMATDNSFYDVYTFDTKEGYAITVDMTSSAFDTYLLLQGPDGEDLGQNDDVAPLEDTSSRLELTAPKSGTYTITANSKNSGMTGAYQVHVTAREASAASTEPSGE